MKTINFETLPYYDCHDKVSNEWIYIALVIDGEVVTKDYVNRSRWNGADEETRNRHLFFLIDKDLDQELFYKKAQFADPEMYDKWYKHEFYIDEEDASEFIRRVPRTRHARSFSDFQASMAVTEGWKHFKALRSADFNESVAANLAYWRGYIAGMEYGYAGEGKEALTLMGLKSTDKYL
jgi:hypothetical protein